MFMLREQQYGLSMVSQCQEGISSQGQANNLMSLYLFLYPILCKQSGQKESHMLSVPSELHEGKPIINAKRTIHYKNTHTQKQLSTQQYNQRKSESTNNYTNYCNNRYTKSHVILYPSQCQKRPLLMRVDSRFTSFLTHQILKKELGRISVNTWGH